MEIKRILLSSDDKPRVVTQTTNWKISSGDYVPMVQLSVLHLSLSVVNDLSNNIIYETMHKHIRAKLCGYKSQDVRKNIFSVEEFISLESTVDLLRKCELKCFYCNDMVKILYKQVRESSQWTLDRIDNSRGHNTDNVEISCLSCNLKRRTMYHERFIFTKQLNVKKML
jgi:hypothetical protein